MISLDCVVGDVDGSETRQAPSSPGAEAFSRSQAIVVLKQELANCGTETDSVRSASALSSIRT
jgi:hypothetical protein